MILKKVKGRGIVISLGDTSQAETSKISNDGG